MIFGSACSGIEAASVAWNPLGWRAAWLTEIEPFPSAVLAHHYPDVPNLGDMTKLADMVANDNIEAPDVLVGGTPCQAFSVAGARKGLADDRGFLTIKYVELANAIDEKRAANDNEPAIIVWENVPGVLSSKDNAFGAFLGLLSGEDSELEPPGGKWSNAGYVHGPQRTIAWRVLDAQYFGVAQRRRRVFLVASARKGFDPTAVLFEREGVRRDTAPSRSTGQAAAAVTLRSTQGGSDVDHAGAGHIQPVMCMAHGQGGAEIATERSPTLTCNHEAPIAFQPQCVTGDITHTLKAEGFDASEDGTGRGQTIVPVVAGALGASHGHIKAEHAWTGQLVPAYSVALRGREGGATAELGDDLAGCLRASSGGGDKPHALVNMAVRRLTPTECERLQGFPDGYTQVPFRNKPAADGPRYKALGNSMAVPCMEWIGRRIKIALGAAANDNQPADSAEAV